MTSWVRYCVAVYVGLLISGALVQPRWVAGQGGINDRDWPHHPLQHEAVAPSTDRKPFESPPARESIERGEVSSSCATLKA